MWNKKLALVMSSVLVFLFLSMPRTGSSGEHAPHLQHLRPMPKLIAPSRGDVVTGSALVMAEQRNKHLSPFDIRSARFEISSDGITWFQNDEVADLVEDYQGPAPDFWEALLDTEGLAAGEYLLRVTMETFAGQTGVSRPVRITVNKPPAASAAASGTPQAGEVLFDGTGSVDPDGQITNWTWDFGDGNFASGPSPVVQHFYAAVTQTYAVTLAVEDDRGAVDTAYYTLSFGANYYSPVPTLTQDKMCICKDIQVRKDGEALGPDGKPGGKIWPSDYEHDGKTLGPFNRNPKSLKSRVGYAFEIVAEVEGNPGCCTETQIAKSTTVYTGLTQARCNELGGTWNNETKTCTVGSPWTGTTADLNADGVADLDVSSQAKCVAAGGRWDGTACHLAFPQEGNKYKPHSPGGKSRYDTPSKSAGLKAHAGTKILWLALPHFEGGAFGTTGKSDLVAMVRGTDGKYCYIKLHLELERNETGNMETLASEAPVTGADSVPGVLP